MLLRLVFDRPDPLLMLLEPLGTALAAAAVGSLVWRYYRTAARGRSKRVRQAGMLVTSGVALTAAASGIGVVLNAALSIAVSPLAVSPVSGGGARTLLLGGISSLAVGGCVWWLAWRPREQHRKDAAATGRRVYLITVFGLSAAVALVALLVIGYRLFEDVLAEVTGGSLVDRTRAPLGLLLAAGYHFAVWRQDRARQPAAGAGRPRTIGHIILVTASDSDPDPLRRTLEELTGAGVTVWRRTGVVLPAATAGASPGLAEALAGISARRVLVVDGGAGSAEVIALRD